MGENDRKSGMKLLSLLAILALGACGRSADSEAAAEHTAKIECRLNGAAAFERVCTMEGGEDERGFEMTVRRPDGGFRRLRHTGSTVETADGAEPARVTRLSNHWLEVEIGGDAYRVPPWVPE